jgi:hypothetical protein
VSFVLLNVFLRVEAYRFQREAERLMADIQALKLRQSNWLEADPQITPFSEFSSTLILVMRLVQSACLARIYLNVCERSNGPGRSADDSSLRSMGTNAVVDSYLLSRCRESCSTVAVDRIKERLIESCFRRFSRCGRFASDRTSASDDGDSSDALIFST